MKNYNPISFDTRFRTITEKIVNEIILDDQKITWTEVFYADFKADDEAMPVTNELFSQTYIFNRFQITSVKKYWYYVDMVWGITINCKGAYNDMQPCFKEESEADSFISDILEWIFNKEK